MNPDEKDIIDCEVISSDKETDIVELDMNQITEDMMSESDIGMGVEEGE